MLERNEKKIAQREIKNEVFVISQMITNQLATNEQCFRIAVHFGRDERGCDDQNSPPWKNYFKGVEDVDQMQKKRIALTETHEKIKHESTSKRSLAVGLLGYVENPKMAKKPCQLVIGQLDDESEPSPVTASTVTEHNAFDARPIGEPFGPEVCDLVVVVTNQNSGSANSPGTSPPVSL